MGSTGLLDAPRNVEGLALSGCVVEGLHVPCGPLVVFCHYGDTHTLMAKASTMTDSMDVVFPVERRVMVDG